MQFCSFVRIANVFAQIGQAVYSLKETLEVAVVDNKFRGLIGSTIIPK